MSLPNRVTQVNRDSIHADFAGGTANLRFWFFSGDVASADGDDARAQYQCVWNGRSVRATIFATSDMGVTIVGMHLNRNLTAVVTQTLTATVGNDAITIFTALPMEFAIGDEISISVDPTNDPGRSALSIALQNDSP